MTLINLLKVFLYFLFPQKMDQYSRFEIKVAEEIIDQAIMNNKPHYLIKWKYFPHQYDTWESIENLESVVEMLQSWIRNKRQTKEIHNFNSFSNAASYCDTVNFINPNKRQNKKRKIRQKKFRSQTLPNQVVILDEDQQRDFPLKYEQNQSNHNLSQSIIEQDDQKVPNQVKWGANTKSKRVLQNEQKDQKVGYPLSFDPEKEEEKLKVESENINMKKGMKVIGRVRSEDIENIIEHFVFKDILCFKVQLNDGRITNMRDDDLKKLCPQMLMEYYEENDLKV